MNVIHALVSFFSDYTLKNILLGTLILGAVSGFTGCFAVLKKQSLLGDAVSHAALPGVVLSFLLTGTKTTSVLLTGALLSAFAGTLCINAIVRTSKIDTDASQAIVLGSFLGLGFLLLSYVQKLPSAAKAGLDRFIFGQAATIIRQDVIVILIVSCIAFLLPCIFWKELKLAAFDPQLAHSIGFFPQAIEFIVTLSIVFTVIAGIQAVGVILMSALIVAPATAARRWTNRLGPMCILAAVFGSLSGAAGSIMSALAQKLPAGPAIVLVLTAVALVSILFGPKGGVFGTLLKKLC